MSRIERLYAGLQILFEWDKKNETEGIDFKDSDLHVIPKCASLSSAPEHSHSGYIAVAVTDYMPNKYHDAIMDIKDWHFEYPYYVFYML